MKVSVNFASREYLIARKAYAVILLGIFLCAILFIAQYTSYAVSAGKEAELNQRLAAAEKKKAERLARYKEVSGTVSARTITSTREEARLANDIIRNKSFSWTLFLNRFEELVPSGIGIESISPNFKTMSISISGSANNIESLLEFIGGLTASEYFEDLPPSFKTSQKIADKDTGRTVEHFNLSIRYYPDGHSGRKGKAARGKRGGR